MIADASFDADQTEAVHTGTYVVDTSAGDVTVLKEQSTLGTLAKGQATSTDAQAESSDAGRLARLVAQSAFYQMEQPYTSRYLLMTFSRTTEAGWIDQVMSAFEQASWLNLTDLKTMAEADPYNVSDSVNPDKADDANTANTRSALRQLADSRHDIMRMATSILRNEIDSDEVSSLDPQALARQDANDTVSHSNDPTQWIGSLLVLHDDMALRSMSGSPQPTATRKAMVRATKTLASDLLNGVRINPSESISVFSESAKMPITVSNDLPYAVSVQVNSLTDSMQIVTSRTADIDIPSHSDAQVTFTIRVSTSGSSTAHVSLTDREGNSFGNTQDTAITSVMRVSDASGLHYHRLRRATGHYRPVAAVPSEEGPRRMSSSVGRNSLIMATGTAASRVTGQLRTILLAAAIGTTGLAANAYQAGSMIPQSVFTLVSGGIFNAVLVPQIVRTLKEKTPKND